MWYEILDRVFKESLTGKMTFESRPERTEGIWRYLMKKHCRLREQILQEGLTISRYSKEAIKAIAEIIIWTLVDVTRDVIYIQMIRGLVGHASRGDGRLLQGFKLTIDTICFSRFTLCIIDWRGARVGTINRLLRYQWEMTVA